MYQSPSRKLHIASLHSLPPSNDPEVVSHSHPTLGVPHVFKVVHCSPLAGGDAVAVDLLKNKNTSTSFYHDRLTLPCRVFLTFQQLLPMCPSPPVVLPPKK